MWNQTTDKMFLELREDAVLIFEQQSLKLLYLNAAAKIIFPETDENTYYSDLFSDPAIEQLLRSASPQSAALTLDKHSWFPESAVVHVLQTEWQEQNAFAIRIDRRVYGSQPEALQMMQAVLASAYFTALRIDLKSGSMTMICDKNPLMNTQAKFGSFADYIALYAEAVIHPEDRAQFLASFSSEQLHLFLKINTSPICIVRRLSGEEYRWASFTLAAVDANVVLLLGKDSNEQHLQEERFDRYRTELEKLAARNGLIVSAVSDIFRLMLHVDLKTGDTILCSLHPDLEPYFSFDTIYHFDAISNMLMQHVHPDDREILKQFSTLEQLRQMHPDADHKANFEYRRIAPQQDPNVNAKWTRSEFSFMNFEDGIPTEAIYAVQDIDKPKQQELEAKRTQDSLTSQFYTLIQNRFLWFIENDYSKQIARCYRIANHMVMPPMECPFGQFFERMIMPHCHPEDYKRVAMAMLPAAAEESYRSGKRQISVDYRHKTDAGWRYVRAEMYLQTDANNVLHTMIYVSDIDDEVRNHDIMSRSEREQLVLRRKFSMMIQDSFLSVGEVDLDADVISHYRLSNNDFVLSKDEISFSEFCSTYPDRFVHPEQRAAFRQFFCFDEILRLVREGRRRMKHLFLVDVNGGSDYLWCNVAVQFFRDENGKGYLMTYVEDVNDEIRKRDANVHALNAEVNRLRQHIRMNERIRIRKAHILLNSTSNFRLALNQLYSLIDQTAHTLPDAQRRDFRPLYHASERLTEMTDYVKDMILLENNQLPLLKEPINLLSLLYKIRRNSGGVFEQKKIKLVSYATHVTNETVICDSGRLSFLIDSIFFTVIRSLPDGADVTLQLAQSPIPGDEQQAMYEFSLVTHGDSASERLQRDMLSASVRDPLKFIENAFLMHSPDDLQYRLYLSKRLIALMHGALEFVRMPDHASAVILRLPFQYVPQQILFPLRRTFGKRALVWDSQQPAAIATMEILRESGMQSDWQADYKNVCVYLELANKQQARYDLLVLRQSDLNARTEPCMQTIRSLSPQTPIFIIKDASSAAHTKLDSDEAVRYLRTPVFRSVFAEQLWDFFGGKT